MATLNDYTELIRQAEERADRASLQMERFTNGPDGAFVETESGPMPTLKTFLSNLTEEIEAGIAGADFVADFEGAMNEAG